jgi:hypothetical protein
MSGRRWVPCSTARIVGHLVVGTDPRLACQWCRTVYDGGEFDACPVCVYEIAEREREHWAAIRHDAQSAAMETADVCVTLKGRG